MSLRRGPHTQFVRSFYHYHNHKNTVVRVPSPITTARLKRMDYKINGMMEKRPITSEERVLHFKLRQQRAAVMKEAGHKVHEVNFPRLSIPEALAWLEFPLEVKKLLVQRLLQTPFCSQHPAEFDPSLIELMIEEGDILRDVLAHPVLVPYEKEIVDVLISLASGLPDWMFFANTEGLSLGQSPVLDDRPVRLIWKARYVERQPETAAAIRQALDLGEIPVICKQGADEGRADWGQTNVPGVWIGFDSSRTNPRLYDKVVQLTKLLQVANRPEKIVRVQVREHIPQIPDLRQTFYHKDLTALYVPGESVNGASHSKTSRNSGTVAVVTEAVTEDSVQRLVEAGVHVTPIPLQEGLAQGMNAVVLWGERHGGVKGTQSVVLMPPGCPTLQTCIEARGFKVEALPFGSPSGGGNWECETNFALEGFNPLGGEVQAIYARIANNLLRSAGLDDEFQFISSSDLEGFTWQLDDPAIFKGL